MTVLIGIAAGALASAACTGRPAPAASRAAPDDRYGALPSFLPTSSLRPDGVLTGSARRPAVTSEGDAVRVVTTDGSVLATVVGPRILPTGGSPQPPVTAMCTWTVTLSHARGRVPIDVGAFATIDEKGRLAQPRPATGATPPPASIAGGAAVQFELSGRMHVGEGVLRWAPDGQVVAFWNFVAETD